MMYKSSMGLVQLEFEGGGLINSRGHITTFSSIYVFNDIYVYVTVKTRNQIKLDLPT